MSSGTLPGEVAEVVSSGDESAMELEVSGDLETAARVITASLVDEHKEEDVEPLNPTTMTCHSTRGEGSTNGHEMAQDTDPDGPKQFLEWLISPVALDVFLHDYFERGPFVIHRPNKRDFFKGWFGKQDVEELLASDKNLKYGLHVDVTRYQDGARVNLDAEGVVDPAVVWNQFSKGWSVRVLHPERWNDSMFLMLSAFERFWNCVAGCNAYLTPAGAQGFSPHYDDIDAFIIQTEGRKRWKLYRPLSAEEVLPRFPSRDFEQEELGPVLLDDVLEPGDLLYMPRGIIHQAVAAADTSHSMHVTVSVNQLNTWADYLKGVWPAALELATMDYLMLRKTLPRHFLNVMGVAQSDKQSAQRSSCLTQASQCMGTVDKSAPWDAYADEIALKFMRSRLPLPPSFQQTRTSAGETSLLTCTSRVRMVAPLVARLSVEDERAILCHALSNRREVHNEHEDGQELSVLEFPLQYTEALEQLLGASDCPISVSSLSLDSEKQSLDLVKELHEVGLLVNMSAGTFPEESAMEVSGDLEEDATVITDELVRQDVNPITLTWHSTPTSGHEMAQDTDPDGPKQFLEWLISPMALDVFLHHYFERDPFVIHRPNKKDFFKGWFGKQDVEELLASDKNLKYGLHVDVTRYQDGARVNLDAEGVVDPAVVWNQFSKGWSVRVLHPERWNDSMFLMLSAFERFWNCVAGCNAYLTPAGAQGFSPHYDDIDAFIIQTEGRKRWKLYRPLSAEEVLPRFPSRDFEQEELGPVLLDDVLEPGDLLYMPRGIIHQAVAAADTSHSMHVTVSVNQLNTWADHLQGVWPTALEMATMDYSILRKTLPRDFLNVMGVAQSDKKSAQRTSCLRRASHCMGIVDRSAPWDAYADEIALKFMRSRLPLPPSFQRTRTSSGGTSLLTCTSRVRMVAPLVARLVVEDERAILCHALSNRREVHNEHEDGQELSVLDFPIQYIEALEQLLGASDSPISVASLSLDSKKQSLNLVEELHEVGLLVIVD